jgi:hypothetical protein
LEAENEFDGSVYDAGPEADSSAQPGVVVRLWRSIVAMFTIQPRARRTEDDWPDDGHW